jgi:hypothetical protein
VKKFEERVLSISRPPSIVLFGSAAHDCSRKTENKKNKNEKTILIVTCPVLMLKNIPVL